MKKNRFLQYLNCAYVFITLPFDTLLLDEQLRQICACLHTFFQTGHVCTTGRPIPLNIGLLIDMQFMSTLDPLVHDQLCMTYALDYLLHSLCHCAYFGNCLREAGEHFCAKSTLQLLFFFFFFKHQEPVPSRRCPLITLLYCTQLFVQVPRASTLEVQWKLKKKTSPSVTKQPLQQTKIVRPKMPYKRRHSDVSLLRGI